MLPYTYSPQSVSVSSQNGIWIVTAQQSSYTFTTEADANAFASIARESIAGAQEWYVGVKALLRQFETLLSEARRLSDVYTANRLEDLITATPTGTNVPGMGVPTARAVGIGPMMQDLTAWLDAAAVGVPATGIALPVRRTIIGKRD